MTDPFIRTYDVFDAEYCNKVIEHFKFNKELGCTARRNDGIRKDHQQDMNPTQNFRDEELDITDNQWDEMDMRNSEIAKEFFGKVNEGLKQYVDDLGLHKTLGNVYIKNMLVQGYDGRRI